MMAVQPLGCNNISSPNNPNDTWRSVAFKFEEQFANRLTEGGGTLPQMIETRAPTEPKYEFAPSAQEDWP